MTHLSPISTVPLLPTQLPSSQQFFICIHASTWTDRGLNNDHNTGNREGPHSVAHIGSCLVQVGIRPTRHVIRRQRPWLLLFFVSDSNISPEFVFISVPFFFSLFYLCNTLGPSKCQSSALSAIFYPRSWLPSENSAVNVHAFWLRFRLAFHFRLIWGFCGHFSRIVFPFLSQ